MTPTSDDGRVLARDLSVVWLTNLPAPYRLPVWSALACTVRLSVLLLAEAPMRGWTAPDEPAYRTILLRGYEWSSDRFQLFFRDAPVARALAACDPAAVVISGWDSPAYWRTMLWAKRRGRVVIGLYESTSKSHLFRAGPVAAVRAFFFRRLDHCVVVGEASRDAVLAMGIGPERLTTAYNYSDLAEWPVKRPPDGRGHVYLFVGRLVSLKKVDDLITAFAQIRTAEDRLLIVGDGPCRASLNDLVSQLGVDDAVEFLGELRGEALASTYDRAQTLCLTSSREVWGLVVNEGLSRGLHAVISDRAGVAASVRGMRGVYVIHSSESDGISVALAESRSEWRGPVPEPEVAAFSAPNFAAAVLGAIQSVGIPLTVKSE